MVKWLFTTVTEKYDCPRCNAKAGTYCRMPSGRQANTPHTERVRLASKGDINDSRVPI